MDSVPLRPVLSRALISGRGGQEGSEGVRRGGGFRLLAVRGLTDHPHGDVGGVLAALPVDDYQANGVDAWLQAAGVQLAQAAQNDPVVKPYRSFLNLAEGKIFCVMEAPNADALAAWFKKMKMPCDSIAAVELEGERGVVKNA